MVQLLKSWFRGLFAPRTKAQGLSNEPTYSQVERLIAAAGGASAQGGSLYSKPTYSQFERLIAAVAASSAGSAGKADRVAEPTDGNLAALDANGNLKDSGYKAADFVEKGATNILIGSGASKANNVTNAVVIGVNASANGSTTSSAVAIGNGAKAKKTGAIQLGAGENSEEKSLRFRDTTVVGGDGKIPTSSLRDFPALESVPDRAIAASTAYAVGDALGDGGKAYRCKLAYTSAADPVAPGEDAEHWTEVPVLDSVASAMAGEIMPAVPTQNELADAVKKIFTALGGGIYPEVDQEEEK